MTSRITRQPDTLTEQEIRVIVRDYCQENLCDWDDENDNTHEIVIDQFITFWDDLSKRNMVFFLEVICRRKWNELSDKLKAEFVAMEWSGQFRRDKQDRGICITEVAYKKESVPILTSFENTVDI